MKMVAIFLVTVGVSGAAQEPAPRATEEPASRCMGIRPLCPPGQHPLCICESDYSYNCAWICASAR